MKISGMFDVKLAPLETYAQGEAGINLGRMSIDKEFHGELEAKSQGEMLSAMTASQSAAGYVAIEQVSGTLADKAGSFVLQHYGLMNKGSHRLTLEVVPGSGSGELEGLIGSLQIRVEEGQHFYDFDYDFDID